MQSIRFARGSWNTFHRVINSYQRGGRKLAGIDGSDGFTRPTDITEWLVVLRSILCIDLVHGGGSIPFRCSTRSRRPRRWQNNLFYVLHAWRVSKSHPLARFTFSSVYYLSPRFILPIRRSEPRPSRLSSLRLRAIINRRSTVYFKLLPLLFSTPEVLYSLVALSSNFCEIKQVQNFFFPLFFSRAASSAEEFVKEWSALLSGRAFR